MDITYSLAYLIFGFAVLIFSGDKLVEYAVKLALRWNISPGVIAVTLLAAGTSAPEFVTSFLAAYSQSTDISVGNVVGSNIFNLMGVGGLALILNPKGNQSDSFYSWVFLVLGTLGFLFVASDLSILKMEGWLLLFSAIGFVIFSIKNSSSEPDDMLSENTEITPLAVNIFLILVSLVGLVGGAQIALKGGVAIGEFFGLSDRIIGVTIISIGTGLPELATSISAVLKKRNDMALANVIGSNIYNTLAIPGATATIFPMTINKGLIFPDSLVMLSATILLGVMFLFKNSNAARWLGFAFVGVYLTYLVSLFKGT